MLDAQEAIVRQELAIHVGLIVNELVTNAAKHAFPEGAGEICVRLAVSPDMLELEVRDDGKGIVDGDNGAEGLGARLVAMLARRIDAEMTISAEGGTSHRFRIPWRKPDRRPPRAKARKSPELAAETV